MQAREARGETKVGPSLKAIKEGQQVENEKKAFAFIFGEYLSLDTFSGRLGPQGLKQMIRWGLGKKQNFVMQPNQIA